MGHTASKPKPFAIPQYRSPHHGHIIAIMMENRSFDQILGYLYTQHELDSNPRLKDFGGAVGKTFSNKVPDYYIAEKPGAPDRLYFEKGLRLEAQPPNPGESFQHVMTQLYGTIIPESNLGKVDTQTQPPYNMPPDVDDRTPNMSGFVEDYIQVYHCAKYGENATLETLPDIEDVKLIMQGCDPEDIPVTSTLARSFAVCDHWFASVPSQTFTNRSFFLSGSSKGKVNNDPYSFWAEKNDSKTIFEALEEKGLTWCVYYDSGNFLSLTLMLHYPRLAKYASNFQTMRHFFKDMKRGTLPHFCLIEPRFIIRSNSMHPPEYYKGTLVFPTSITDGDYLLHKVYSALRKSPLRDNTMLFITFDEAGGTYDHVGPPNAASPGDGSEKECNFSFRRLGERVPTIIISPWIENNTVCTEQLQHTSFMKYVFENFGIEGHLTERDWQANSIPHSVFERTTPRKHWPKTYPVRVKKYLTNADYSMRHPLDALGKSILLGWLHLWARDPNEDINSERKNIVEEILSKHDMSSVDAKELMQRIRKDMHLEDIVCTALDVAPALKVPFSNVLSRKLKSAVHGIAGIMRRVRRVFQKKSVAVKVQKSGSADDLTENDDTASQGVACHHK